MQKKILVIRFSSIGDIVLTSPVIRCLHEQLNAEVHVITKDVFADLYRNNPHVHNVIMIKSKVEEVADVLHREKFDFVADLHNNLRSLQVKRICKTASASFPKLNVRKWIQVNLHADVMPDVHIVDRYFKAVEELGVKNDGKGLDYFITEKNTVNTASLPATHQRGYIALTAGAKFATKEMPVEKIIEVINRLQKPVVVLGGKAEAAKGEAIAKACGDLVVNTCGQYNLDQSASLIQQADLVITHDTGMMHIAAAFKKKIYSVWGNTVPEFGMYPYLPAEGSRIIEVKNLYCRPCSKIGYAKCPQGHFRCMNDIPVSAFGE
ncbi:MAG TPA: glycosyltransferase family 9 protein [Bacteroidia bacterium]|nr:glycosyltransferase family 9 protein [Bacteroidia bacterium]